MAITRTPIIDDNGTGTTGTILNNAWKQELYNQIDAAAVAGQVYTGNGSNTGTGIVTARLVPMPASPRMIISPSLSACISTRR